MASFLRSAARRRAASGTPHASRHARSLSCSSSSRPMRRPCLATARRLGFCFGRMQPQTQTQHPAATAAGDAAAAQPAGAADD
eukprot:6035782-Prymnesium_polylepis.1